MLGPKSCLRTAIKTGIKLIKKETIQHWLFSSRDGFSAWVCLSVGRWLGCEPTSLSSGQGCPLGGQLLTPSVGTSGCWAWGHGRAETCPGGLGAWSRALSPPAQHRQQDGLQHLRTCKTQCPGWSMLQPGYVFAHIRKSEHDSWMFRPDGPSATGRADLLHSRGRCLGRNLPTFAQAETYFLERYSVSIKRLRVMEIPLCPRGYNPTLNCSDC